MLAEPGEAWDVFRAVRGELPRDEAEIKLYDGFLITGSCSDAHGDDPCVRELLEFLGKLDSMKKKVLGICFGHQAEPDSHHRKACSVTTQSKCEGSLSSSRSKSAVAVPPYRPRQSLECYPDDFRALNSFHEQLDTPIDGWDGAVSRCCQRPGVMCENSTGIPSKVVGLILANRRLKGKVAHSLADLDHLKVLNLSCNLLHGLLPAKLFQMQRLEVLDLSYNNFYGSFDSSLDLPSIKSFNISNNYFDGLVEATLCHNASYIETLDLSNNNFGGQIPTDIANCSYLQQLFLNGNNLYGNFPEGLYLLHNLQELRLQRNRLSGQLDDRIGELVKLVELDISDNWFSGKIPDSFSGLIKLEHFSASSNRFSGPLPASLMSSPSLSLLNLGNNSLTGPISINCSSMLRITDLDLHANLFDVPIPEELSTCHGLSYLNLDRNYVGVFPSSFRNLKALKHLLLPNTSLVNFSAALENLQHCKNLTTLVLNRNFMNEEIPQNPELQFRRLKTLLLANSQLRGSLPIWLGGCTNLLVLDLSGNRLGGTIPIWIGQLNHLFYLDLSLNSLTGDIPESFGNLGNLTDLNLSSMADPSSSFSVYLSTPGRQSLRYKHIWNLPPTVDLSNNMLAGPVLPDLGNLKWLHVLKMSNNSFSGNIPDTVSGMENLESMDLSLNNLSGEIPLSLMNLNFLSNFNVSFNKLYGTVPSGGQFSTFPSSCFIGNSDLHGLPLAPCQSVSDQTDQKHYAKPPAEEESVMAHLGPAFEVGGALGFCLTVWFCFGSGWVFKE